MSQFLANNAAQSTANGIAGLVDEHARVVVKFHDAAVGALIFLSRANNDGVTDVASPDLVGGGNGDCGIGTRLRTERSLLLDDDDDAIACRCIRSLVLEDTELERD